MERFVDFISQPWHWSVSGFLIAIVMFLLLYYGKRFGVSSSFRAVCAIGGAGKRFSYFQYNWRDHDWLLIFVFGSAIGGFLAMQFLANPEPMAISSSTISYLESVGLSGPDPNKGAGMVPAEIFNWDALLGVKGLVMLIGGGFLVGFGTRYASGCTSGHAISGLANLQLPSLIAVIGFFIGGLLMTHVLLPLLLAL